MTGVSAPINNALDRAGLPRFSTQRYLVIWAGFAAILLLTIGALVWLGASSARESAPRPTPTALAGSVLTGTVVTVGTTKGLFTLELYADDPAIKQTIRNFRTKVASGYYNDKVFHRVEDWLVQTGDPRCGPAGGNGCGKGGGGLTGEYNDRDFKAGSVGMASTGSRALSVNDSQWFILKKDEPNLKGNYPNFGMVTSGLDVIDKLVGCKPKAGGGADELDCSGADRIITATIGLK
jgi:peptidyl-prolyl cis-trans isomerase B (cyclophilin B)